MLDVGFGDAYRVPLKLDDAREQLGPGSRYRITTDKPGLWKFWELEKGAWEFYYAFTLHPCTLADFFEACQYYATSPKSSFTQKELCTRAAVDGHITITDHRLVITRNGEKEETLLAGRQDVLEALRTHFGVILPPSGGRMESAAH